MKSDFYQKLVPEDVQSSFSIIDPQAHSERRRLLATPMADSSLKVLEPIVAGKVRLAITRVKDEMDERGVADVFQWWIFMATDIIGELTFGRSFGMLESKKVSKCRGAGGGQKLTGSVEESVHQRSRATRPDGDRATHLPKTDEDCKCHPTPLCCETGRRRKEALDICRRICRPV